MRAGQSRKLARSGFWTASLSRRLFESCSDLVYAGLGANFVAIDAGRAADADATNNLIANLDTKTAIDERNARQLG